jgi:hypothetical protein
MRSLLLLFPLLTQAAFAADDSCDGFGELTWGGRLSSAELGVAATGGGMSLGAATAVGDFDGDGIGDVAVGAPNDDAAGTDSGSILILYGPVPRGARVYRDADARISGNLPGGRFGASIATIGDVDGDGRDDLLVGAPGSPTASERRGYAVVLYGHGGLPLASTWNNWGSRLLGVGADDRFGASVAAIGDVDADGTPDFAVGAPGSDAGGADAGAVSVWLDWARVRADSAPDLTIPGTRAGALVGAAISSAGDFNADGFGDFAVGAPGDNLSSNRAGAVAVWFGSALLVQRADFDDAPVFLRGETGSELGHAVAPAGDADGDGADDLWVGAPGARAGTADATGSLYLIGGGEQVIGGLAPGRVALSRFDGPAGSRLGAAIAGGVDATGDGALDVAVGAPAGRGDGLRAGLVWVLEAPFGFGRALTSVGALRGAGGDDAAGTSLAFGPDLSGDGLPDLVIGAPDRGGSDGGRAHVVFGGLDINDVSAWYLDADGDGVGAGASTAACAKPAGPWVRGGGDCADNDARRFPGADESRCDGVDYNCDGSTGTTDWDGDGADACADCDDDDSARKPGAPERCNSLDDDCDGSVDEGSPEGALWFPDGDRDGFGRHAGGQRACAAPGPSWTLSAGDCDDNARDMSPIGVEVCDGRDNDCDGREDELAIGARRFFADRDGDAWGDWRTVRWACARPEGFVTHDGDCDDGRAAVHPGAIEVCNYRDDDCDGEDYLGGPRTIDDARVGFGGAGGQFGASVAFVPDWDGDGRDEVAIAAPEDTSVQARLAGVVYIRSGDSYGGREDLRRQRPDGSYLWRARIAGPVRAGFAGAMAVGDFDDDGAADIAVSAEWGQGGTVYVFYGPLSGDYRVSQGVALRGESGWRAGASLAAGDVTGDGVDDLLVGAPGARVAGSRAGSIAIAAGGRRWASNRLQSVSVRALGQGQDGLGTTLDYLGDVTGDGIGDFGSANPRANGFFGYAWVFAGGAMVGGAPAPIARIVGGSPAEHAGKSMAGVDLDGDGRRELVLGTDYYRVWIVPHGQITSGVLDPATALAVRAPVGQDFGERVANLGDIDGDGDEDLVVTAPEGDTAAGTEAGAAWILFGGQDLRRFAGDDGLVHIEQGESFGRIVDPVARDPIASTQNYQTFEAGQIAGIEAGGQLAYGVATGGDFDGDGRADLLLGAPWAPWGGVDRSGAAYVMRGGRYGDDVRAVDPVVHHWDRDLDAWADPVAEVVTCPMHVWWNIERPQPYALANAARWQDCDDADDAIHPEATEIPGDGVDQNCAVDPEDCNGYDDNENGDVDEGYADGDEDGVADCVDAESCDGLDNDGDLLVDEGFGDADSDTVADCVDVEDCDGLDNDGDGSTDEGFGDVDGDGIANCVDVEDCDDVDNDGDGLVDEGFPDFCPGLDPCNGVDDDRNGTTDDGYADTDEDGVADCVDAETCDGIDNDGDTIADEGFPDTDADGVADCQDVEVCDGLDNDGDGARDDGFPDTDADGVADCVDPEVCDFQDNDGDGAIDEGFDADSDGWSDCEEWCYVSRSICSRPGYDLLEGGGPTKRVTTAGPWGNINGGAWIWTTPRVRSPEANETMRSYRDLFLPTDLVGATGVLRVLADNNVRVRVNGELVIDEQDQYNWTTPIQADISDLMLDGGRIRLEFETTNLAQAQSTPAINPAGLQWCLTYTYDRPEVGPEQCNGWDDDCNARIDDALPDADGDGICNQMDPEVCNGVDDDADGLVDEGVNTNPTWFLDLDGDGWGGSSGFGACGVPEDPRYVERGGDCDDDDDDVHPQADEVCNNVDDDCNGVVDDDPSDGYPLFPDRDMDSHGDENSPPTFSCDGIDGYAWAADDCDDLDPNAGPCIVEYDDGVDNDCDGEIDEIDVAILGAYQCMQTATRSGWDNEMWAIEAGLASRGLRAVEILPDAVTRQIAANTDLRRYHLVIYTKCGEPWQQYNQREIDAMRAARAQGTSILLFDDDLTVGLNRVTAPAGFLLFNPVAGAGTLATTGGAATITLTDIAGYFPPANWGYADPISWPWDVDVATAAGVGEHVLGRTATGSPAFVAMVPPDESYRQVSMLFGGRYSNPSRGLDATSDQAMADLLHSSIAWLLRIYNGPEVCGNGLDDDMDGEYDDADAVDASQFFFDHDGDGFGYYGVWDCYDPSYATVDGDCDDWNADVSPVAREVANNSMDDDCDWATDEGCDADGDTYVDDGAVEGTAWQWSSTSIGGAPAAGTVSSTSFRYDPVREVFNWSGVVRHPAVGPRVGGLSLAVSWGDPWADRVEFYIDATRTPPVLSAYFDNGLNNGTSWQDGQPDAGIQAPVQILSSLQAPAALRAFSATVDATQLTASFEVSTTAMNGLTPSYGDTWGGCQFYEEIGVWHRPVTGLTAAYEPSGWLKTWNYANIGPTELTWKATTAEDVCGMPPAP